MRIIYADPGLAVRAGHHISVCHNLTAQFRARGIQTTVLGASNIANDIRAECGAEPFFSASPYFVTDGDPICGWLTSFFRAADLSCADFGRIPNIGDNDILYLASSHPAHLFGLAQWMAATQERDRPMAVADLIFHPGMNLRIENKTEVWSSVDPRQDARAAFYRYAGLFINSHSLQKIRFMTSHASFARVYAELLKRKVGLASMPFTARGALRNRAGQKPITIAVLGQQTETKGYRLMPEVFAQLLQARNDIRLLVHNSEPRTLPEVQHLMRRMAAVDPRIILNEKALDDTGYKALLDSVDLALCPYDPTFYRASKSGVVAECIANGIPAIVPADTVLAAQTRQYGSIAATFTQFTAPSILEATLHALDNFDACATAAYTGAEKWAENEGAGQHVETLLRIASELSPV
ncbi:MAG: hypothetical protein K2P94_04985 [Rhodospirillaceae bacterium]|nr:hypothetical protein [Rhodospirillaceae bacterium]